MWYIGSHSENYCLIAPKRLLRVGLDQLQRSSTSAVLHSCKKTHGRTAQRMSTMMRHFSCIQEPPNAFIIWENIRKPNDSSIPSLPMRRHPLIRPLHGFYNPGFELKKA